MKQARYRIYVITLLSCFSSRFSKKVGKNPACNFSSHAGKFSQLKARFQQVKDDTIPTNSSNMSIRQAIYIVICRRTAKVNNEILFG